MNSSRLPGKILMPLRGQPMLARQLQRLKGTANLDEIVVATTVDAADDPVVALARLEGVAWFRGDEHDVLHRYLGAARASRADVVVRMTADCPLIDPAVTDRVVEAVCEPGCDYASNVIRRTYPRGLDVEAFHRDVLERMARLATSSPAREHVTYFVHREHPELFLLRNVADVEDHSDLRWTVDTEADLALVRAIYELADLGGGEGGGAAPGSRLTYRELVGLVRARPDLVAMNAHIVQKAG